jgi:predicted anti-sigma-YlaC factor YlaD
MITCEEVRDFLLDADLPPMVDTVSGADLESHLDRCPSCAALLAGLEEAERMLSDHIGALAATVAPNTDPTAVREQETLASRRRKLRWAVLMPLAAAVLGGVAFFGPRSREVNRYQGGPDWALPVANLQSIQPVVISSSRHTNVAVLPTENPNITIVWFME